ncbi:isochorismatase family superfamily protein [Acanthamoeba castellanii str. Neff]|uniref:Isochorismatase family superfamily protein n=1 Tax=Acanthamoeba castellanii (strain ATCC 30010 / Neff) TaxID=1257118 RepID=L8GWX6_ACACF|nr:isochorismatase family superfamily protein [Acanthamoeba castellanii str. Neff]ELR17452.1 isochorismatase family superfamily protein [Acanthamoeba castellanii str. Neff]
MEKYDKVVLLLIDVQRAFFSDIPPIGAAFPDFRHNVERLLGLCRSDEVGIEVVHVRAVYNPEVSAWTAYWHALNPDKKTVVTEEPEDFTRELPGEKVLHKNNFDGFLNAELDKYLKEKGKTLVVCCGLITSCCVLFTTSGAFMRGYKTVVVEDCCGDRTVEKHDNTMNTYGHYMFTRATVDTLLATCDRLLTL